MVSPTIFAASYLSICIAHLLLPGTQSGAKDIIWLNSMVSSLETAGITIPEPPYPHRVAWVEEIVRIISASATTLYTDTAIPCLVIPL